MRAFLLSGSILVAVTIAGVAMLASWNPPAPTILLITMDMTRADHLGLYGYSKQTTFRLDRLAAEGVVFEQAFTPATLSGPAHASMMTGLKPVEHGLMDNAHKLSESVSTIAERLRGAGYHTAGFVSYGLVGEKVGLDRGFETFLLRKEPNHSHRAPPTVRQAQWAFDEAATWLRAHPNRSFAWVHAQHPHFDFRPPEAFEQLFLEEPVPPDFPYDCIYDLNKAIRAGVEIPPDVKTRLLARYDGEIALMDAGIGMLLDALEESGAWKNTTVIVASDHGATFFERGNTVDHVDDYWEEILRVPLLIRSPDVPPGRVHGYVPITAIAATIAEIAGIPALPGHASSLMEAVRAGHGDETFPPTAWFHNEETHAVRVGRWKFVADERGVRHLYDLDTDPEERTNLVSTETSRVVELEEVFKRLSANVAPSVPISDPETLQMLRDGGYLK